MARDFEDTMLKFVDETREFRARIDERTTATGEKVQRILGKVDSLSAATAAQEVRITRNETDISRVRNGKRATVAIGAGTGGVLGAAAAFLAKFIGGTFGGG